MNRTMRNYVYSHEITAKKVFMHFQLNTKNGMSIAKKMKKKQTKNTRNEMKRNQMCRVE